MAIEIPHEVALFLNFAGVPYPDINEDQVRELATHVGNFAAKVRGTHEAATGAIKEMNGVWSGYSYEQLLTVWARMSVTHMAELDRACKVVAAALNAAAEVIVVTKVAVLSELAAMASTYLAAMAGTFATGGLSAVAAQSLPVMANKLLSVMEQALIAYILAEVLGKAIEPLSHIIERMVSGALRHAVVDMLDLPSAPSSSAALPMRIEPDEVLRYADLLDAYADQMLSHAQDFANKVGGLDFTTESGRNLGDRPSGPAHNPPPDEPTAASAGPPPATDPADHPIPAEDIPARRNSPPPALPAVFTGGPDRTAASSVSPSGPTSPRRGMDSAAPATSAGSAANAAVPAANSTGQGENSAASRVSATPWRENSGMRREAPAAESVRGGSARVERTAAAPRTSERTETPTVAVPSESDRVSEPAATGPLHTTRERSGLDAGLTADAAVSSGSDRESTARQPDPRESGGSAGAHPSASPWRGGPARRRGSRRAADAPREPRTPAVRDPRTPERGVVPAPERGVTSTPWSKRVRESDTAAKVFAPQTSSLIRRVRAPHPVREDEAGRENPAGSPVDPVITPSDPKRR
ncbi:WXG100-like domain-containing protein [Nocardia acidivorans]|uniref:WXG100-like domain-containing protein n=1 Tax=Nocardia acidivorans TaxID=404580 RepID=UPI000833E53F|nr:hypothetical protein [Nocardia acidivorans]